MDAKALRCFCAGDFKPVPGASDGPLAGLTFAVKDFIDTEGTVTGCGNPDWRRTHGAAPKNAVCVQRLLDAGGTLVGKTITDELAFSLEGENYYEGTPVNPVSLDRIPGGSSSGSAVAVAGGLVDFALGTDTGGSIRVPAAFCGIYGIRPAHGAISTEGAVPFAPSLDTVGWFARDAAALAKVGAVLLPMREAPEISQILIAEDAFDLADTEISSILMEAIGDLRLQTLTVNAAPYPITDISEAYRHIQAADIVDAQGAWLREANPRFGPNIAPRFASIWASSPDDVHWAKQMRSRLQEHVASLFQAYPRAALALPSAPCFPPKPGMTAPEASDFYTRALAIGGIASLCGLPQIAIPIHTGTAALASLGLAGGPCSDRQLLDFAVRSARAKEKQ